MESPQPETGLSPLPGEASSPEGGSDRAEQQESQRQKLLDRAATASGGEFHFKELKAGDLPVYRALVDLLVSHADAVSFKLISLPRAGVKNVGYPEDMIENGLNPVD